MLRNRTIAHDATLLEALKKMDDIERKSLIVLIDGKFEGLLSAGDIQRAIIQNKPIETKVSEVLRRDAMIASPFDNFNSIKQMMFDHRMEICPVVTNDKEIVNIHFWEDVFQDTKPQPKKQFSLPVVIMAGGIGSRLKPLTNVLPKPLIPIGNKTIVEQIFQRFHQHGCTNFYISVNFKAELIEYYLKNQKLPYQLEYFKEDKPLGTAGSLSMLKGKINETFFMSNCDIIIDQDYSELLDFHRTNKNEITIIAALKHYPIPYGTIKSCEDGKLVKITEKPELTFKINSGMYIFEPHLLEEIPENQFLNVTQLIVDVQQRGGNLGVYPVSEKSWRDIGEWDEYLKNNCK